MNTTKRTLSILLCLCMVCTLISFSAADVTAAKVQTIVVNTIEDTENSDDGYTSLREALAAASKDKETEYKIIFDPNVFTETNHTITLASTLNIQEGTFSTNNPLTVDGFVSSTVTIVINGTHNNTSRAILSVAAGNTVTLSHLTLQNANCAVYNEGKLTTESCTFTDNYAKNGGAIYNSSTLTAVNCTFTNNLVDSYGGAICNDLSANSSLLNCILVGNESKQMSDHDVYNFSNSCKAFYCRIGEVLRFNNTIDHIKGFDALAGSDGTTISLTNNAIDKVFAKTNSSTNKAVPEDNGTFTLLSDGVASIAGTKLQVSQNKVLQYRNGTGWVNVTDKDNNPLTTNLTTAQLQVDQFCHSRLSNETLGYSIGAISVITEPKSLTVNTTEDVADAYDKKISLREAVTYAASGTTANNACTITFDPGVFTENNHTIKLNSPLIIEEGSFGAKKPLTIDGSVSDTITTVIDGKDKVQLFLVNADNTVTLTHLTLQKGSAAKGGSLQNNGTLTTKYCTFTDNSADSGGSLYNSGTLTTENCIFTGNSADDGGSLYNDGTLNGNNCTFTGNSAANSGGTVYNNNDKGILIIGNCTFTGNSATNGGAVYDKGYAYLLNNILVGNDSGTGSDVYSSDGHIYAFYCLVGAAAHSNSSVGSDALAGSDGTTISLTDNAIDKVFAKTDSATKKAVPEDNGTFALRSDGAAPIAGTKLQVDQNKVLQYWNGTEWVNITDKDDNPVTTTLPTAQLQVDQLGYDRLRYEELGYSIGALAATTVAQATLTLSGIPDMISYGDTFTASTKGGSGTGTVTYSSDNPAVAAVNTVTGEVTIIDVGTFTITATKAGDEICNEASVTSDALTANPKSLTIDVTVADKKYDGSTQATILNAALIGVINNDEVMLTNGEASFASFASGKNIAVNFTEFSIYGNDIDKYTLIQPTGITADIYKELATKTSGKNPAGKTIDKEKSSEKSSNDLTTGDSSNLLLWFVLLLVSGGLILIIALRVYSKKRKIKQK